MKKITKNEKKMWKNIYKLGKKLRIANDVKNLRKIMKNNKNNDKVIETNIWEIINNNDKYFVRFDCTKICV